MQFRKGRSRRTQQILALPIILSTIVPFFLLDLWIELYHRICFRLYGLEYISRLQYIKVDRHKLQYLNWYEKIGCAYCGYANGLIPYVGAIAAATEAYWCGIMHKKDPNFTPPAHHADFVAYGDKKAFLKRYPKHGTDEQ
jgi:hypothetical protein